MGNEGTAVSRVVTWHTGMALHGEGVSLVHLSTRFVTRVQGLTHAVHELCCEPLRVSGYTATKQNFTQ